MREQLIIKARKLHGRRVVHGLQISIENAKGSTRHWYDPHGKESGSSLMHYDYGYIRGTEGTDGDHVDVYIGPNPESLLVFIVDQMKKPEFAAFDEQKVMLGFNSAKEAKRAYLRQYDDPRFFGGMRKMMIDAFKQKVLARSNRGKMIKAWTIDALSVLTKAGPYLGPRGGLWADPQHTVPWRADYKNTARNEARIEAMGRRYERARSSNDEKEKRYALRELKEHGVTVHPEADVAAEKPKPKLREVLFHSTPAHVMASIKKHGLKPRKGAGLFEHGGYDHHSQGKVFLSNNFTAAKQWHGKVKDQLEHHHDDTSKHDAVMLRVKHRETHVDEVGDKDISGSRYVRETVPPSDIEFFHKKKREWRPLSEYRKGAHGTPDWHEHELAHGVEEPVEKAGPRLVHKYKSRKPDGKGGWIYEYDEPEKTTARTGALPIDHEAIRTAVDKLFDFVEAAHTRTELSDGRPRTPGAVVDHDPEMGKTIRFDRRGLPPSGRLATTTMKLKNGREVPVHLSLAPRDGKQNGVFRHGTLPDGRVVPIEANLFIHGGEWRKHLDGLKQKMRRVLAHEWTHGEDRTAEDVARKDAKRQRSNPDEAGKSPTRTHDEYRNLKHEVSAKIQEITRSLMDKKAVAEIRAMAQEHERLVEEDPEWYGPQNFLSSENLFRIVNRVAPEFDEIMRDANYTKKNQRRIYSAIASTLQGILEGKVKPIEKAKPISVDDLRKSAGKPPGAGWQPIPNGRHGGYRRRRGTKWEYWYPEQANVAHTLGQAPSKSEEPKRAEPTEADLASGSFDKRPLLWQRPPGVTSYWTNGGVDPQSKWPVKYEGRIAKLYQIEAAEAPNAPGFAVLRDVETGEPFLARHDRIYRVEYAPRKSKQPEQKKWTPGVDKPPTYDDGVIGVSGETAPKFEGSKADPKTQPGLYAIENGVYPMKEVLLVHRDDDGSVRRTRRMQIGVHDHGKHQLVSEFDRLVNATAKTMQKRFRLPSAFEQDALGRSRDLTLVELRRAGVEGLLAAIEAYRADGPFAATAQQYVRDHVRIAAAREALGGIALPQRHQRNLARYVAARAKASQVLGVQDPSPEQVLAFFDLRKKHVHANLSADIGNQPVPMSAYQLHAEVRGQRDTEHSPGKAELARLYHEFIEGTRGAGEFNEESIALPALGVGVGFSPEQRIAVRQAIVRALDALNEVRVESEGRKRITYTANVSDILLRKLGLLGHRDEMTNAEIAREVPVFSIDSKGARKQLDPRVAAEKGVIDRLLESGLRKVRESLDEDSDARKLIKQAEERVAPPVRVENGPTWGDVLVQRAAKVSPMQIAQYRQQEAARLRAQATRMRERATDDDQRKLADVLDEASKRAERMDENEVRMRLAQRLGPVSEEMRKLATQSVSVEAETPGVEYGSMMVDIVDPSTGATRRVKMRTFRDMRSPWERAGSLKKADAGKLSASMLADVLRYPRLMKLLFAPEDAVGAAPTLARSTTEMLAGLL